MAQADAKHADPPKDVHLPDIAQGKVGIWVFLSSEVVVFGGLIISFLLFRLGNPQWEWWTIQQNLKELIGTVNTIILLTSSLTIVLSYKAFDQNRPSTGNWWLLATILLGCLFMGIKSFEWYSEITHGYYLGSPELDASKNENLFWAFYYGMTGLHGVHVLGGIVANLLIWLGSVLGWTDDNKYRLEYAGLYWHFVDIVWVFLFPLFYLMFPFAKNGGH
jgi:cytochrome c oxidase subunit 3